MDSIRLIVGLANPGAEYANTRHNAGAWYLQHLAQHYQITLKLLSRFSAQIGQMSRKGEQIYLLIPTTFMNLSGHAIARFANFHQIQPQQILIAHDELDLAPGSAKFKQNGGHAGHNGVRNIIQQLQQQTNFYRLRIGIGHPGAKDQVVNFVLGCAPEPERMLIDHAIDQAVQATELLLQYGVVRATNYLHQLPTIKNKC